MPLQTPLLRFAERTITPGTSSGTVNISTIWYFWDGTKRVREVFSQADVALEDVTATVTASMGDVEDWRDEYVSGA